MSGATDGSISPFCRLRQSSASLVVLHFLTVLHSPKDYGAYPNPKLICKDTSVQADTRPQPNEAGVLLMMVSGLWTDHRHER